MSDDAGIRVSELRHVVAALQSWVGAPVQQAWVPSPTTVILGVGRGRLLVESHPFPRMHSVDRRPPNPPTPFSFQGLLRSRFRGPVDAILQLDDDRVVEIVAGEHTLHARLFGRGGGIWLLHGDRVLATSEGPAGPALPPRPPPGGDERPPRFTPDEGEDWDRAARRFLTDLAATSVREARVRAVRQVLKREAKRLRRLVDNLSGDLADDTTIEALRHQADALAAHLHAVPGGTDAVDVPDPYAPGTTITVPLDPKRSPADNLTRLYDKARRLDKASGPLTARLATARSELDEVAADRAALAEADDDALEALHDRWVGQDAAPSAQAPSTDWWTWRGPSGHVVRVGKHDRGNHALVTRGSRGRDWWVHVRDRPSPHVVIESPSKDDTPPLEVLLAASQLALDRTRATHGDTFDVQYARVAQVSPMRGAGPGKVKVTGERVLHVTSAPAHLAGWTRDDG